MWLLVCFPFSSPSSSRLLLAAHQTALDAGLSVIACIGESLEVREANKTLEVRVECAARAPCRHPPVDITRCARPGRNTPLGIWCTVTV